MNPRLADVIAWRDALRACDAAPAAPHLSAAGARFALEVALDALGDAPLARATRGHGAPFPRATVVCARTVFTASLEWCAVLLARGTRVTVKHPRGVAGLLPAMVHAAEPLGLPLTATDHHDAVLGSDLVIAMGADATVDTLRERLPTGVRFLGFGHRFSVAWVRTEAGLQALATDAALHDGLGCMSPAAVFTDLPADRAGAVLAAAMAEAEERWPRGALSAADAAAIRTRRALARAAGSLHDGPGWSVPVLPASHFSPASLPRTLALHPVADREEVLARLRPHLGALSTVGTDDPSLGIHLDARQVRICAPGQMQRPPLERLHDGVDWLSETARGSAGRAEPDRP